MSTNSEDAHLPSWAQGSERTLALLDLQQQQRRKIDHDLEIDVLLAPHHLEISDAWTFEIETVNHPPSIIPPWRGIRRITREQGDYTVQLRVQDANPSDTHVWRLISGGDAFAQVSGTTLTLDTDHSTAKVGRYNIVVEVEDQGGVNGKTDRLEIRIRLVNPNYAPVFDAVSDDTITSLEAWTYTVAATDRNDDVLTYGYTITPEPKTSKITFDDQTGVLKWTPKKDDEGITFQLDYTVSDGNGGTDTTSHEITVAAASASKPVIVTANPTLVARREGTGYRTVFIANDDDADITALTWSIHSGPGSIISQSHRIWQGKRQATLNYLWTAPQVNRNTDYTVVLRVTATGGNPAGEYRDLTFKVRSNHNAAPVLAAIGDFSVQRGGAVKNVKISATDAENNPREFYEPVGPAWITVTGSGQGANVGDNRVDGNIRAAPPITTPLGGATLKVGVRETAFRTTHFDTEELTVTVTEAESSPPVFTGTPNDIEGAASKAGQTVDGFYTVQDTGAGKPTGMSLKVKSGTATVRGSPTKLTNDRWRFTVRATYPAAGDNNPIVVTATATGGQPANEKTDSKAWNVSTAEQATNFYPSVVITKPTEGQLFPKNINGNTATSFDVDATVTDYEGTTITPDYELTLSNGRVLRNADYSWSNLLSRGLARGGAEQGPAKLVVTATDTVNGTSYETKVTVNFFIGQRTAA